MSCKHGTTQPQNTGPLFYKIKEECGLFSFWKMFIFLHIHVLWISSAALGGWDQVRRHRDAARERPTILQTLGYFYRYLLVVGLSLASPKLPGRSAIHEYVKI